MSWDKSCNPCLYTLHLTLYTKIALVAIFVCIYQKKHYLAALFVQFNKRQNMKELENPFV